MKRTLAGLVLLLCPTAAHACAVCFSGSDQNRIAFLVTTVVLSLLPLGLIGGGILWLRRQARMHASDTDTGAPAATRESARPTYGIGRPAPERS